VVSEWTRGRVLRELKQRLRRRSSFSIIHTYRQSKKYVKPVPRWRRLSYNFLRIMMR